ncbi:MAG TPA: HEAT repeat domain-containing protein [Anaerolineaceae bacterium]|nr:HEAT repeat domain-containing protein [Anaerolineaceae bacterium]
MAEFQADPRFPSETQRMAERQTEIEQCLRQLKSKIPRERSQAAKRLGDLRAEPAVLLEALRDPNPYVRSAAAFAVGYAAEPEDAIRGEVVEQLLAAIDDPNDHVCAAAVHSLGVLRTECAREQILDCLYDENPHVVQAAILAAARIGSSEAGFDGQRGDRAAPTDGLAERLACFLDSGDYSVVLAATRAMYLLEYRPASGRLLENLREILHNRGERGISGQKDFTLPKAIIETLTKLKYHEAIPLLVEIAQREIGLRSAAVEALIDLKVDGAAPLLAPLLRDPSEGLRRHLVEMMVSADYRSALPLIRGMIQDPSAQVRDAALVAVAAWKDAAAVETVRQMAYSDPNPFVRPRAVAALASLAGPEAIRDLRALAGDANGFVRQAASAALEQWGCSPPAGGKREETASARLPEEVDAPGLLRLLEAWQAALPAAAGEDPLEEIAAVDEALTRLISRLRKNRSE